ncbi:MAG: hypothetical protein ACRDH5_09805, partial [bacterium]
MDSDRAPEIAGHVRPWSLRSLGPEFVLVAGLIVLYEIGRLLVRPSPVGAYHNAVALLWLEQLAGLSVEPFIQQMVLGSEALVRVLNTYYV